MGGFEQFLLKTTHDLIPTFTDMLVNFHVLFFLFSITAHKVRVVRCGSGSLQK